MPNFIMPPLCTIGKVNAALREGGHEIIIFDDPYTKNRITAYYRYYDSRGEHYYSPRRSTARTAREWAVQFDRERD